jgi:hypothetical protein
MFIAKAILAAALFAVSLGLMSTETAKVNVEESPVNCTVPLDCGEGYLCVKGNCIKKPSGPKT